MRNRKRQSRCRHKVAYASSVRGLDGKRHAVKFCYDCGKSFARPQSAARDDGRE